MNEERIEISERTLDGLERRIDRLSLLCYAMWTVIQAHADASDQELQHVIEQLDLSDGERDGKVQEPQVTPCAACQRPVGVHHLRCQYCGEWRRPGHPFEGVL